ncbi:hypothetical protein E8E11_005568 [Didymella keratinophila]|nr:hypothetical protein E8E11_005568 [Didymella keratinophila]
MTVVLELGMQYLWVDRYCIDQEDKDTKFEQISNMNLIYTHADLTIIATTGDAYYGLPGVDNLSRSSRRCIKLGSLVLHEIFRPDQLIQESTWASRAWTYQEGCLSRRKLFFTKQGVSFWCGPMYCEEGLSRSVSLNSSETEYDEVPNGIVWTTPSIRPGSGQTVAEDIIQQYQSRDMSFQSDALNACLGILNALDVSHFWGVAIQSQESEHRRIELCWINRGPESQERSGFPTWSWTRWSGRKTFSSEFRPSSLRAAEIQLADGTWLDILHDASLDGDLTTRSPSRRLRITGNIMQHRLDLDEFGELQLVLHSTLGRDFHLRIVLDHLGPLAKVSPSELAALADTTVLEIEPLGKNDNNPGDLLSASYLLLKNRGDFYTRIGLTDAVRIGGLWGLVNRTLQSGLIPLVGTAIGTIDLE